MTNLTYNINENLVFSGGFDVRYYIGSHYYEVYDLLGGSHYEYDQGIKTLDADGNELPDQKMILKNGDIFGKNYDGKVLWGGLFGQLEYTLDDLTVFGSAAISNTNYSKEDFINYLATDPNRNSEAIDFFGYNAKGGANYNIDDMHNVFVNGGIISRAPFFNGLIRVLIAMI